MKDILNTKQQKVLNSLLDGDSEQTALAKAGYASTSRTIICKIRPVFQKILKEKQEKLIESTITKEECIKVLKKIACNESQPRLQIQAITQLSKLLGYESPSKVESTTEQVLSIKIIEDNDTNTTNTTNSTNNV